MDYESIQDRYYKHSKSRRSMKKPHQILPKNNLTEEQHKQAGNVAVALMSRRKDGGSLNDEFEFYLENQQNFAKKYEGKMLVIKDQELIGVYESKGQALNETVKKYKLGTFLIQACSSDPKSVTQTFHSRVRIPCAESS